MFQVKTQTKKMPPRYKQTRKLRKGGLYPRKQLATRPAIKTLKGGKKLPSVPYASSLFFNLNSAWSAANTHVESKAQEEKEGGEKKQQQEEEEKKYCICQKPEDGTFYICCDNPYCMIQWFHPACIGLSNKTAEDMQKESFLCAICSGK
jgi:hypothetical protein